jgi:hypothetical protein
MSRKLALALALACSFTCAAAGTASAATATPASNTKQLTTQMKSAQKAIKALQALVGIVQADTKANATTVATVIAGVPAIVDGLTQLKNGLTTLGQAYSSVEYGAVIAVCATCTPATAVTPALVTSDIPDDGNSAAATATIPMVASAAGDVKLFASIRSAESDGLATGDPAGQVGGVVSATCASGAGCGGSGTLVCSAQSPAQVFSTPTGDKSLTLRTVQNKADRTDSTRPRPDPSDPSSYDALNGGACRLPTAGAYLINIAVQFVDIPSSLTPGATE